MGYMWVFGIFIVLALAGVTRYAVFGPPPVWHIILAATFILLGVSSILHRK